MKQMASVLLLMTLLASGCANIGGNVGVSGSTQGGVNVGGGIGVHFP